MICELCQKEFTSYKSLHGHLTKEHKIAQSEYYQFFFPRYDLFDGEKIDFKDRESYFKADFNFKDNLFSWLKDNKEKAKDYSLEILRERAERKSDWRLPTHVELKSLFCPSLIGYEKIFNGLSNFYSAAKELGFNTLSQESISFKSGDMSIKQDTREQYPLSFDCKVDVQKLSCGDYCPSNDFFCDLFIERKSLNDLVGTLTQGLNRFKAEIQRAKTLGFYLVVMVECRYSDLADYKPSNSFSKQITGPVILNRIRTLSGDNIQFLFSGNRSRSVELIEKIFRLGELAKKIDLELIKDKNLI